MAKSRCFNCGLTAVMPDDSKLILVNAPKDENGLNHYFLYCRSCHKVTDLEPAGCLGMLLGVFTLNFTKPVGVYDPVEVLQKHPEAFGIFAPKIQTAMRADGIIR